MGWEKPGLRRLGRLTDVCIEDFAALEVFILFACIVSACMCIRQMPATIKHFDNKLIAQPLRSAELGFLNPEPVPRLL